MPHSRRRYPAVRPGVTAVLALAVTSVVPATAAWNTGVGGNAARSSLGTSVGPATPEIRWEGSRPGIVAQQGVADGDLVVVNRIQSFTIPTGTWIVAHELADGAERWAVQLPFDFPATSWRSRVSAIRDGQVYATRSGNTNEDYLYALSPVDGSILWRSVDLIDESTTESLAFAPNGDLVAGNFSSLLRISRVDGTTVWETPRTCPTSGGCEAAIFGDHVYVWEAGGAGPMITAFDLTTGARLYSSAGIGGGFIEQIGPLCGPDGTVYAPRAQNNPATDFFVALEDTGSGFTEKWRVPMGYAPFASFGIGPDGSVYTYSRSLEILRLDPATGAVLDTSSPIPSDGTFSARIAIDTTGSVYLTNGGFSTGALFAFTADLTPRWSVDVPSVNVGGPVLTDDGTLIVCGIGDDVRAYRSTGVGVATASGEPGALRLAAASPNPMRTGTEIGFEIAGGEPASLRIYDARGRLVRTLLDGAPVPSGRARWDGRDDDGHAVAPGVYVYDLSTSRGRASRTLVLAR